MMKKIIYDLASAFFFMIGAVGVQFNWWWIVVTANIICCACAISSACYKKGE